MFSIIKIRRFKKEDAGAVFRIIQKSIDYFYPEYYPKEAIDFFKEYHSKENILDDAASGYTVVATSFGKIVGTGTIIDHNMRRVYINPGHARKGIGKMIVRELEREAVRQGLPSLDLSGSLCSLTFWRRMGFTVMEEGARPVENNQVLRFYEMMKKYGL